MGLLSRASHLDSIEEHPGLAFSDFIIKYSLKICALLEIKDSNYFVSNSAGFDARSIISATSTADYWNGICKESSHIYYFSEKDKSPLLQLFSFNLKDCIKELSAYKSSSGKILLCAGKLTDEAAKDFEKVSNEKHKVNIQKINPLIKDNSEVLMLNLNFEESIQSFISSECKDINKDYYKAVLMNEIYNRFCCFYNVSDATTQAGSYVLRTILITNKAYSFELISNHIVLNLKEVLEKYADLIHIELKGTADSCEKVKLFLQAE